MEITKAMYEFALNRIEQLLPITEDSMDDPNMAELMMVSSIVEQYEKEYFPMKVPTLGDVIANAMDSIKMTGKELAEKLGVSQSRVSDYVNNRAEPTLKIARMLCKILDIRPSEILGVA